MAAAPAAPVVALAFFWCWPFVLVVEAMFSVMMLCVFMFLVIVSCVVFQVHSLFLFDISRYIVICILYTQIIDLSRGWQINYCRDEPWKR